MINLSSITKVKNGRTLYVLPGCVATSRPYYALDVLMEISELTERTIEARSARNPKMLTKMGAVITRKQSGNTRFFLGA